jgi:hypothetical protein
MLAIAAWAARRRDRESALVAVAVVAFPLAYTALYAITTPYAKENNFLQILPFTALAAAFLAAAVVALSRRSRLSPPRALRWAAAAALAAAVAAPTQAWVYRSQVPETWEIAIDAVAERLRPWEGRIGYLEAQGGGLAGQPREVKALLTVVDDLSAVPVELLDQADVEVFPAARLDPGQSAFHAARVARGAASKETFSSRWFVARGPAVVAVLHPRQPAGTWTAQAAPRADGAIEISLPALDGELLSIELWRPRAGDPAAPEVLAGERRLRLHPRSAGRMSGWLTERFQPASRTLEARVPSRSEDDALMVRIYGWR